MHLFRCIFWPLFLFFCYLFICSCGGEPGELLMLSWVTSVTDVFYINKSRILVTMKEQYVMESS